MPALFHTGHLGIGTGLPVAAGSGKDEVRPLILKENAARQLGLR